MPKSEQGVTNDRYTIIPRTLVFVTRDEDVLLLKGSANKRLWANRYNGIGGHIERREDALTAARREMREETGLEADGLRLVGTVLIDASEGCGIGLFVFHGEYSGGELRESGEGSLEWVKVSRLSEYALVEDLVTLLPRALNSMDIPFSALYTYDEEDRLQIQFGE